MMTNIDRVLCHNINHHARTDPKSQILALVLSVDLNNNRSLTYIYDLSLWFHQEVYFIASRYGSDGALLIN